MMCFTVDYPAVAVEPKATRPITYILTRPLSVAYERNQLYLYFILKLLRILETVTLYLYLNFKKLSLNIYFIANKVPLELQPARTVSNCFQERKQSSTPRMKPLLPQPQDILGDAPQTIRPSRRCCVWPC